MEKHSTLCIRKLVWKHYQFVRIFFSRNLFEFFIFSIRKIRSNSNEGSVFQHYPLVIWRIQIICSQGSESKILHIKFELKICCQCYSRERKWKFQLMQKVANKKSAILNMHLGQFITFLAWLASGHFRFDLIQMERFKMRASVAWTECGFWFQCVFSYWQCFIPF